MPVRTNAVCQKPRRAPMTKQMKLPRPIVEGINPPILPRSLGGASSATYICSEEGTYKLMIVSTHVTLKVNWKDILTTKVFVSYRTVCN